jgi:2-methylcitrate dehydratase PrpD
VLAAYLAAQGFTGSLDALEAPFGGFMSTLHGQHDPATILAGLGAEWETARVGLKAYAACASAHTTIDGVLELRRRGLSPENLDRLTVRTSQKGYLNIGWPYKPGDIIAAQMNGHYAAAIALLDGDAFIDQYAEQRLADPDILSLIRRIDFQHDAALDRGGAAKRHAVKIDALRRDGSAMATTVEQRRGSADHPLSRGEIEAKFRRIAAVALSARAIEDVIGLVGEIERERDLARLTALIRPAA